MGYEAQVASLPDRIPGKNLRNLALRYLKRRSVSLAAVRRSELVAALQQAGWNPGFVNGGGYTASGAVGADKLPVPYLPEGARLSSHEGAGEVQTPVSIQARNS